MTDDRALVSRIVGGDMQAFRLLIKQHERIAAHMIGRLIDREEDREELCQDVFLKVFEKIGDFNFQARLSTWIATIAYRHAINHLRKKKIPVSDIPDEERFSSHFISTDNVEEKLEDKDLDDMVLKLIGQLPVQYKTVLTLYHLDGKSYPVISPISG